MEEMTFTELQQKMQLEKKKEGTAKYASRHVEDIYNAFKSLKSNWSVVVNYDLVEFSGKVFVKAIATASNREEKEQAEAKAKAEAARLAEIEAMAKQSANEEIKAVNAETGEVIEDTKPVEEVPSKPAEPYKVNLSLTFHGGEKQWHQFAKLLDDNFVNYEIEG